MSNRITKMRGLALTLLVMGGFGVVSMAEAKTSTKIWDPQYGADLPDLGWSGKVTFDVRDSCLIGVNSSKWISDLTYGCFGALSIKSATVTLYDYDALATGGNGMEEDVTLSYQSGLLPPGNLSVVPRMYIDVDGGLKTIKAVQAAQFHPLWPEITDASFAKAAKLVGEYDAAAFWLSFNSNQDNSYDLLSNAPPAGDFAFLNSCSFDYANQPAADETLAAFKARVKDAKCSQNDGLENPAILRPIPEPEGYLLGLASFGVLGVWARRRRLNAR